MISTIEIGKIVRRGKREFSRAINLEMKDTINDVIILFFKKI